MGSVIVFRSKVETQGFASLFFVREFASENGHSLGWHLNKIAEIFSQASVFIYNNRPEHCCLCFNVLIYCTL